MRTLDHRTVFSTTLLLILFAATATTASADSGKPYNPTESFFMDCGTSSNQDTPDGKNWQGDVSSKFISPSNPLTSSSTISSTVIPSSVSQVPYSTARIFHSNFTYTFPVSTGQKFVRLHFYPVDYPELDKSASFFSVTANNYTLLRNFSASLTVSAIQPTVSSFVKEFIVTVSGTQILDLTFYPATPSYAFINGIEVFSIPDDLYAGGDQASLVGSTGYSDLDNRTALETLYRLNVGGNSIDGKDDTGMFRYWAQDVDYVSESFKGTVVNDLQRFNMSSFTDKTPNYTAPIDVYGTWRIMGGNDSEHNFNTNLTWIFSVDTGFNYLMRLHFCDMTNTKTDQFIFLIYMNYEIAEVNADIFYWSGGAGIPVYRDYVVMVPDNSQGKKDLLLSLQPNRQQKPTIIDVMLSGVELFKMNKSDGSLAGPNPEQMLIPSPTDQYSPSPQNKQESLRVIMAVVGSLTGAIIAFFVCFFVFWRRKRLSYSGFNDAKSSWLPLSYASRSTKKSISSLPSDLCRRFSLAEIKAAVNNFDNDLVIGSGGFGNVYKGSIDGGMTQVAIKRLNSLSKQGINEFQTEIEMLSKLRHLHLVSLIGYSEDNGEMILVYEYMAGGTLREHLYKTVNPPLSWKKRLEICIGSARGLHYLHTGTKHMIIHRDIKSTNILLDNKWVAKVSDFGLSKMGPADPSHTHVSTVVKGSFGYVDPEYYRRQQLTEKSDVYSFGVVLFEVLCARPAIIQGATKEQINLAVWARNCYKRGTLDQIIDPHIRDEIATESLNKFGEVASSCLYENGTQRPTMSDLVWSLEFVLQLQETAEKNKKLVSVDLGREESPTNRTNDDELFSNSGLVSNSMFSASSPSTSSAALLTTSNEGNSYFDEMKSENVFSEIVNPNGR